MGRRGRSPSRRRRAVGCCCHCGEAERQQSEACRRHGRVLRAASFMVYLGPADPRARLLRALVRSPARYSKLCSGWMAAFGTLDAQVSPRSPHYSYSRSGDWAAMLASLRNLLWPKQRRRTVELSTARWAPLSLLPEDVFTARVACYFPRAGVPLPARRIQGHARLDGARHCEQKLLLPRRSHRVSF